MGARVVKPARPVTLWACIVQTKRSRWIHHGTLSRTKAGSRDRYQRQYSILYAKRAWLEFQKKGGTIERVEVRIAE